MPHLGAAVRARRRALDLTLQQVGRRAGLSVGFLSQIERDLATPSLSALAAIAAALDVGLDAFLATPHTATGLTRRGERAQFSVGAQPPGPHQVRYERLSADFPGHALNSVLAHLPPGYRSEVGRHEGEEMVFILEGSMIIDFDPDPIRLDAGDSLHYAAGRDHRWRNAHHDWTRVLWTGTVPIFDRRRNER